MSIYYIYKLEFKKTGQFYFGITNNIDRRKSDHITGINNAFHCIRKGKRPIGQLVHISIATKLVITKNAFCKASTFEFIKSMCKFTVIDIVDTLEEVFMIESSFVNIEINNPKNLNSIKYKNHATNKTTKRTSTTR
jgi:hypothetical protein